jgi:hypothetical protein
MELEGGQRTGEAERNRGRALRGELTRDPIGHPVSGGGPGAHPRRIAWASCKSFPSSRRPNPSVVKPSLDRAALSSFLDSAVS